MKRTSSIFLAVLLSLGLAGCFGWKSYRGLSSDEARRLYEQSSPYPTMDAPEETYPVSGFGYEVSTETSILQGNTPLSQRGPIAESAPVSRNFSEELFLDREARMSQVTSVDDAIDSMMEGNAPRSEPAPEEEVARVLDALPFAKPVSGKAGFVTIPGQPNLPEIDVRGIPSGTPVEISDPFLAGATIQFKVP
ncbi:MAG: hypothetical protein AAF191_01915 [Verrucomicrobiota bacterium]